MYYNRLTFDFYEAFLCLHRLKITTNSLITLLIKQFYLFYSGDIKNELLWFSSSRTDLFRVDKYLLNCVDHRDSAFFIGCILL